MLLTPAAVRGVLRSLDVPVSEDSLPLVFATVIAGAGMAVLALAAGLQSLSPPVRAKVPPTFRDMAVSTAATAATANGSDGAAVATGAEWAKLAPKQGVDTACQVEPEPSAMAEESADLVEELNAQVVELKRQLDHGLRTRLELQQALQDHKAETAAAAAAAVAKAEAQAAAAAAARGPVVDAAKLEELETRLQVVLKQLASTEQRRQDEAAEWAARLDRLREQLQVEQEELRGRLVLEHEAETTALRTELADLRAQLVDKELERSVALINDEVKTTMVLGAVSAFLAWG